MWLCHFDPNHKLQYDVDPIEPPRLPPWSTWRKGLIRPGHLLPLLPSCYRGQHEHTASHTGSSKELLVLTAFSHGQGSRVFWLQQLFVTRPHSPHAFMSLVHPWPSSTYHCTPVSYNLTQSSVRHNLTLVLLFFNNMQLTCFLIYWLHLLVVLRLWLISVHCV